MTRHAADPVRDHKTTGGTRVASTATSVPVWDVAAPYDVVNERRVSDVAALLAWSRGKKLCVCDAVSTALASPHCHDAMCDDSAFERNGCRSLRNVLPVPTMAVSQGTFVSPRGNNAIRNRWEWRLCVHTVLTSNCVNVSCGCSGTLDSPDTAPTVVRCNVRRSTSFVQCHTTRAYLVYCVNQRRDTLKGKRGILREHLTRLTIPLSALQL